MRESRIKIKYSVQLKFVATFALLTMLLLAILNTYPTISMRDLVFSSKQSTMQDRAAVISSSLSAMERLTFDNVGQAMALLDVMEYSRVLITDGEARILYDTSSADSKIGAYALFSEVSQALSGKTVFYSSFADNVFVSRVAMPISNRGIAIGSVYLYEYDAEQGGLIGAIQTKLSRISIILGTASIAIMLLLTRVLTLRITELVRAIRIVGSGKYSHRVRVHGSDEVAELSEEFNKLTSRLENTEELRRRFVSDASHELKTPLATIQLLSDSIIHSENMDADTMREFITDIGAESERLRRITEKLLNLTRLDSASRVERTAVDMKAVTENTLRLLIPLADAGGIHLTYALDDGCIIQADNDDIYQIIFNLVENAIKYNVPGGWVSLRLTHGTADVRLAVEDTGIGIPEADMPNIFTRFYRVDKARSREAGGSGLGLSIVHDAVMLHGGTIEAARREPVGTCFVVSFPRFSGEEAPE